MLDTWYTWIGAGAVLLICGGALWKGDRLEQWGGGLCVLAWLATILIQDDVTAGLEEFALMGVDAAMLVALGALAWRGERSWPVWAAACQAITVAVHLAKFVDFRIPVLAYLTALVLASYGVLISLAIGTFVAWREREALRPR
ncbi:MAG: hypothetical protein K1X35_11410 [Caulobacteraceae bacterium]|nr:hypothetical protein [Caulobacteraceae bacterium]